MAIINVSRQIWSLGDEITDQVAAELKYSVVRNEEFMELVSEYAADFSRELGAITEERQPAFLDQLFQNRATYEYLLQSIFFHLASRDRVLIKGRGGQYVLRGKPYVLSIRTIAPFDVRAANACAAMNVDLKTATEIVTRGDQERSGFIRYIFQKDASACDDYDLVVNTGRIAVDEVAAFLVRKIRMMDETCPLDEEGKKELRRLALAKHVEAAVKKEVLKSTHVEFMADDDGGLTLAGYIANTEARDKVEAAAHKVKGVNKVFNEIMVMRPFAR
jgi:cytidylate kinase